mmetsp:Transcript_120681/g.348712  ORF Transcript_120681/g.348712 Transcript_120681/m.348712 type:complete len:204 (+) Transcript_120681:160-771(+)
MGRRRRLRRRRRDMRGGFVAPAVAGERAPRGRRGRCGCGSRGRRGDDRRRPPRGGERHGARFAQARDAEWHRGRRQPLAHVGREEPCGDRLPPNEHRHLPPDPPLGLPAREGRLVRRGHLLLEQQGRHLRRGGWSRLAPGLHHPGEGGPREDEDDGPPLRPQLIRRQAGQDGLRLHRLRHRRRHRRAVRHLRPAARALHEDRP